ncbi:FAD-dependent thymidylate synthase [bacterium]|nr:FAD-dependent thymidylate synthase [bacterium]
MEITLVSITPKAEKVIEEAARTSYLSFNRMDEDITPSFIRMLIKNGHHSVLEHAYATFRIKGISRASTHQLVRHRIASFTQQSQRYVDEKNFVYITPDSVKKDPEALKFFTETMVELKDVYTKLRSMKIRKEDARYILPNAISSEIVISANMREFRRIFELRCEKKAQWEIRRACLDMLNQLKEFCPNVFYDMKIDNDKEIMIKEQ